jgi:hypothetical protein
MPVFVAGTAISALAASALCWVVWQSACETPGLWVFYGILGTFPMCSIWTALAESTRAQYRMAEVLLGSVRILLFAAPLAVIVGFLIGADVALVLRFVGRADKDTGPRGQWSTVSVAIMPHYVVGIALAVVCRVWH